MQVFGWCKPICICHSDPTSPSYTSYTTKYAGVVGLMHNATGFVLREHSLTTRLRLHMANPCTKFEVSSVSRCGDITRGVKF